MPKSGLTVILIATAIAGVASYVITWLVPRVIGFADYATFAVFWAALYLVVGALFGLQQEVTRATQPVAADAHPHVNRARNFGLAAAGATLVIVLATAPLWAQSVFPGVGWALVFPLASCAASYALVAVLGGTLFGLGQWHAAAALVLADALLRLAGIAVALPFTHNIVVLAWAAVAPFPLAIVVLWPFIRGRVVGRAQLDVGYRQLSWNVARTITAAAATGLMVSGFPLAFGLAAAGSPAGLVGMVILAVTLVRAPLIIVTMALQGYLLVQFRDAPERAARRLAVILAAVLGAGVALGGLAWLVGQPIFGWLFPGEPVPSAWFLGVLVGSSALVAALTVTASAVLARSLHHLYTAGWVTGAVVTILALFVGAVIPLELEPLAAVALLAGPVVGLAVHLGGLVVVRSRETRRSRA